MAVSLFFPWILTTFATMEVKEYNGNLLDSTAPLICHQVNCIGVMGSGVAKGIKNKWPVVLGKYKEYAEKILSENGRRTASLLGKVLPVTVSPTQKVLNYFSEELPEGRGKRCTNYEALYQCLEKTADYCQKMGIERIALPYKLASVRGGADWSVVLAMINAAFKNTNLTVEIWRLDLG